MVETLFWIGLGAVLVWIGVDMIRGGDWWHRLRPDQQDRVIGMPPIGNEELNRHIRESARSKYGAWFAATPLLGVVGVLAGIVIIVATISAS